MLPEFPIGVVSSSRHGVISHLVGGQAHVKDAATVDHPLSEIAIQKRQELASGQGMATAAQAAVAATAGAHQADFNSLSALLSRHLQQQYLLSADVPANELEYSSRSAPAAGGLVDPVVPAAESDADRTESNFSEAKLFDVPGGTGGATTQRRRKVSDATSMQKLQALAEVSEERLAKQEKRMMKNRESAARSRLRRQQHTENLEEHNTALKSEVLTLRAQLALLQGRVSELEWQLQLAQAASPGTTRAAGAAAAAAAVSPTAAAVSPTAAATSPVAATSAVMLTSLSQQGNSLPLSAAPGNAAAAAAAGAQAATTTAAPGLPSLPDNRVADGGCAVSPPAAAGGSGSGSHAFIEALAALVESTRNASAGVGHAAVNIDPAAAAAAPVPAAAGAGGGGPMDPAIAALLGVTGGSGTAGAQADQPGSSNSSGRAQQLGDPSSRLAVPVSSQWQQQQQQNQSGVLQATEVPAALQQQQHQQPVQQPIQQNALPDLNRLLAAALSALTGSQTALDKPHQQQQMPPMSQQQQQQQLKAQSQGPISKVAAGQGQGYGSPLMTAVPQQTYTSTAAALAIVDSPIISGPTAKRPARCSTGMSAALPQQYLSQHDTVQSGVAAILEAMQAAAAAAAISGGANSAAGDDSAGAMGRTFAGHHTGTDGERPSKRMCS